MAPGRIQEHEAGVHGRAADQIRGQGAGDSRAAHQKKWGGEQTAELQIRSEAGQRRDSRTAARTGGRVVFPAAPSPRGPFKPSVPRKERDIQAAGGRRCCAFNGGRGRWAEVRPAAPRMRPPGDSTLGRLEGAVTSCACAVTLPACRGWGLGAGAGSARSLPGGAGGEGLRALHAHHVPLPGEEPPGPAPPPSPLTPDPGPPAAGWAGPGRGGCGRSGGWARAGGSGVQCAALGLAAGGMRTPRGAGPGRKWSGAVGD